MSIQERPTKNEDFTVKFQPIETAPIAKNSSEQILCRFWYPYLGGYWVYFVSTPNGEKTIHPNWGADPEEWCPLPITR